MLKLMRLSNVVVTDYDIEIFYKLMTQSMAMTLAMFNCDINLKKFRSDKYTSLNIIFNSNLF